MSAPEGSPSAPVASSSLAVDPLGLVSDHRRPQTVDNLNVSSSPTISPAAIPRQRRTAVTGYWESKQLLLFDFEDQRALRHCCCCTQDVWRLAQRVT